MLRPDIIEKIKRDRADREERSRPALRVPLYTPKRREPEDPREQEEITSRVIVIDMA